MFDTLTKRFDGVFSSLRGKGRLSEKDIDDALREVRLALLEADVNVAVVKAFLGRVKERAVGEDVAKSLTPGQQVIKIVHEELVTTLGLGGDWPGQGSSAADNPHGRAPGLGQDHHRRQAGRSSSGARARSHLLVAADLQRPAAIDQLETLGGRIEVPVFVRPQGQAGQVWSRQPLKEAVRTGRDVVIVDTAGRLQIDSQLMKELADVRKAADPDEVLLVVDAMTGQDAVNVAKGFQEQIGLTGVILSKLDGDARGGAAISVREVTGAPVKFAGVGEGLDDLEPFHPDRMASRILGMGDVLDTDREGGGDLRRGRSREDGEEAGEGPIHPRGLPGPVSSR